jgi:hypothetical protein
MRAQALTCVMSVATLCGPSELALRTSGSVQRMGASNARRSTVARARTADREVPRTAHFWTQASASAYRKSRFWVVPKQCIPNSCVS